MSDVTEKLRFNVIAGIAPITSQEAIDEIDRLRAALAERDRMLGEAYKLVRAVRMTEFSGAAFNDISGTNWFDAKRAFLSAYDASKTAGKDGE